MTPAVHFLFFLPKKWGLKHVEDGQNPDNTNLSDLAFFTD